MPNEDVSQLKQSVYKPERRSGVQKLVIVIGVIVVLIILVASILKVLTPETLTIKQSTFTSQNKDLSQTKLHTVRYTGSQIDIPPKLAIAHPVADLATSKEIVDSLVQQYELTPVVQFPDYWQGGPFTLFKDADMNTYTFSQAFDDEADHASTLPVLDKDHAIEQATRFLNQTIPTIKLSPQPDAAKPIGMLHEYGETTADKATAYEIPFAPTLNGLPIFYQKESVFPFTLLIDSTDTVRKMYFYPLFKKYQTLEEKNTISIETAVKNIQAGTGSIISVTYIDEELKLSDLQDAELSAVSLEYREDSTQGLVYPFYRFIGHATTNSNVSADIEIITPAIQTSATGR